MTRAQATARWTGLQPQRARHRKRPCAPPVAACGPGPSRSCWHAWPGAAVVGEVRCFIVILMHRALGMPGIMMCRKTIATTKTVQLARRRCWCSHWQQQYHQQIWRRQHSLWCLQLQLTNNDVTCFFKHASISRLMSEHTPRNCFLGFCGDHLRQCDAAVVAMLKLIEWNGVCT